MVRHNNLYEQIIAEENLRLSHVNARKAKVPTMKFKKSMLT